MEEKLEKAAQAAPQRQSIASWAIVMSWSILFSALGAALLLLLSSLPILAFILTFPFLAAGALFGLTTWSQARYSGDAGRTGNAMLGQVIGGLLMVAPLLHGLDQLRLILTS